MQYILTEQEYQNLNSLRAKVVEAHNKRLQDVCTLAAKHVPVSVSWLDNGEPKPWGCILDKGGHGYCDYCPAKGVCPHPHKEWSK